MAGGQGGVTDAPDERLCAAGRGTNTCENDGENPTVSEFSSQTDGDGKAPTASGIRGL